MKKLTSLSLALLLAAVPGGMIAQSHRGQSNGQHRGSQTTTARPGSSTMSPGGNSISRPSGSAVSRPNTNVSRPGGGNGNHNPGVRPGGNGGNHNPGSSHQPGVRPGGNHHPGGGYQPGRPGGMRPGHSAPRPGVGATPSPRPRPYYGRYRPPRIHRWERPLPPPPPRAVYRPVYAVPAIPGVLGLTFGTLIDYGINSLINAGYTIAGAIDNAIYLNNVNQFGIIWPQATIYYGNGGMSSARFQLGSYSPNRTQFDNVYNSLCAAYGAPVSTDFVDGRNVCTWWGGDNTGYITLQYGPGLMQNGGSQYYTDLIIGNGY